MATGNANKRLVREYKSIRENPPPFIQAHPSEHNILEWHYLLTGPPSTPYHNGQYWGTLIFPPEYPFKPPAIRMMTPSGRFQTNTRLCLSISDFHPKSFNPAWEVSTILIGLLSFMTSDEMTTGSVSVGETERKVLAARSRWWNSTGGGTCTDRGYRDLNDDGPGWKSDVGTRTTRRQPGGSNVVRTGDGGERFRQEFPEVDEENWRWMKDRRVNVQTGIAPPPQAEPSSSSSHQQSSSLLPGGTATGAGGSLSTAYRRGVQDGQNRRAGQQHGNVAGAAASSTTGTAGAVVKGGESWIRRHKFLCCIVIFCAYVLLARLYE
ncbi:putative ubiquitin-conjugating enzyme Ubc6 [Peziza echinospora]|nr:putative ubiquitin-conjugating enzyme Ubc6 [Peziza echinospora]